VREYNVRHITHSSSYRWKFGGGEFEGLWSV